MKLNRIFPRLLALMLAVMMLLTLVACNDAKPNEGETSGKKNDSTTETPTEAPTEAPETPTTAPDTTNGLVIAENGSTDYRIVYSRSEGDYAKYAATMLASKLQKATGARIVITVDSQPKGDKGEIILGVTSREAELGFDRAAHEWTTPLYVGIYGNSVLITAKDAYSTFDNLNLIIDLWLESYEENNKLLFNEDTCNLMMNPPADSTLNTFTMLSQNLYGFMGEGENTGAKRSERVLAQLKFYSPDIFSTNEQTRDWIPFFEQNAPEYARIDAGPIGPNNLGQYNSIYYKQDTIDMVDWGYQMNGEAGDAEGTEWPRIIIWAKLRIKQTGKTFLYVSTHLDTASDTVRVLEARRVLNLIKEKGGDNMPVFMAGDMNAEMGSGCYKLLTSFFDDVRGTAGTNLSGDNGTFQGMSTSYSAIIDYHFAKKDAGVKSFYFKVIDERKFGDYTFNTGCFTSDHYALFSKHQLN